MINEFVIILEDGKEISNKIPTGMSNIDLDYGDEYIFVNDVTDNGDNTIAMINKDKCIGVYLR